VLEKTGSNYVVPAVLSYISSNEKRMRVSRRMVKGICMLQFFLAPMVPGCQMLSGIRG